MATEKKVITDQNDDQDVYKKVENFFLQNRNIIIGVVAVIIIGIAGYFGYQKLILEPKQQEAENRIGLPQSYFQADSLQRALDGDGINPGFLSIINNYGNTKTGNLAKYYAGVIYLDQKNYDEAIKYLNDFDGKTEDIKGLKNLLLGHAYSEKNEMDKAVDHYKKAGELANSDIFSPQYYKLAGDLLVVQEKYDEANKVYELIKEKYPLSEEGQNIDKEIAYTKTKMGK